jgi:hypothetical protein
MPFEVSTHPASAEPFCGEYNALVEDVADDVYYHTDYETKKQYKCFKNGGHWFIAEFDSVGFYQEIYRSVNLQVPVSKSVHYAHWTGFPSLKNL